MTILAKKQGICTNYNVTNQTKTPLKAVKPKAGFFLFNRATSYSPTHSRVQYHRG